jgi:flagellar protein FliO/FliZ
MWGRTARHLVRVLMGSVVWVTVSPIVRADSTTPAAGPSAVRAIANLVIGLIIVIVLIVLLVRFLAKRANVQQKGAIQVVAARQLAPNRSVQVVEVGEKRYLIGVGEDVRLLADITDSRELTDEEIRQPSFGQALSAALEELRSSQPEDR